MLSMWVPGLLFVAEALTKREMSQERFEPSPSGDISRNTLRKTPFFLCLLILSSESCDQPGGHLYAEWFSSLTSILLSEGPTKMDFEIRTLATETDKAFFDQLNFESFKHDFIRGRDISEEEARKKFREFEAAEPLDPWSENHRTYFANTLEGELAGLIWLAERTPFYKFTEQLVWIYNLHVLPKYRRHGLARKLLAKADEWAAERGLNSIGCHTLDFNIEARRLYESSGYTLIATHNESCFYEKKISV
jgi:GNAT superfamily N-acetyltransferase